LKLQSAFCQFQTVTVSECCLTKLFSYILFEKYIYMLALDLASTGNKHCASCIGTLSFPTATDSLQSTGLVKPVFKKNIKKHLGFLSLGF